MNPLAIASLISCTICLALGLIVLSYNRKSNLNRLFFLVVLTGFFYSFTTVMMWRAPSAEIALLWHKAGTIWPLFVAVTLHFALVFTHSGWLKNRIHYIILYVPAVLFFVTDVATDYINTAPTLEYWGFNDQPGTTWIYYVSTVWSTLLPLISFALCFRYYRKAKNHDQIQQRKFVAVGFCIPIITFIATNMLARTLSVDIPSLGIISTLPFAIIVSVAIVQYELFTFDAALAAENIFSTIPDSIILTNMNYKIIKVNERLEDFTGYTEEELLGTSVNDLFHSKEEANRVLSKVFEQKVIRNSELTALTKAGDKRQVLLSGSVVEAKTGRPIGLTCVIHDITELKAIEERLVKAERLASIGELAGQVGHDLRNPLTGIKNSVYLIRKRGNHASEEDREEILKVIDMAVEDSNRIITSLVDYSSDLHLQPEQCTPRSLVEHTLAKVKIPKGVRVQTDIANEPQVFLDPQKIEAVFAGILENAVQAIPETGTIQICSHTNNGNLEISFTDTGTGIPENVRSKLFLPLVTTKAKGMGMGLAICKRIVDLHGGKISVESTVGVGTTVKVSLQIKSKREDFLQIQPLIDYEQSSPQLEDKRS